VAQYLRIEPEKDLLLAFIEETDYPNKIWLEDDSYLENIILAAIENDDDETLGYIWGHWSEEDTLSAHIGVTPFCSVDWHSVFPKMLHVAEFLGARFVIAAFPHLRQAKALGRFVQRLGFEPYEDNPFKENFVYRRSIDGNLFPARPAAQEEAAN